MVYLARITMTKTEEYATFMDIRAWLMIELLCEIQSDYPDFKESDMDPNYLAYYSEINEETGEILHCLRYTMIERRRVIIDDTHNLY